jgi:polyisoprenoid-binding protein YceI
MLMSTHAADSVGAPSIDKTIWRIDPDRSSIEFKAPTLWGIASVKGRFSRYQGALDLSGEPAVELTIEAGSLDTKNHRRDKHLRSPDFFDVDQHPYIRFVSQRAALEGERLKVRGLLHARGASVPLDIDATLRPGGDELEIEAVTVADHHQLGMTWNLLAMLRTPSKLTVRGRLVRDA